MEKLQQKSLTLYYMVYLVTAELLITLAHGFEENGLYVIAQIK